MLSGLVSKVLTWAKLLPMEDTRKDSGALLQEWVPALLVFHCRVGLASSTVPNWHEAMMQRHIRFKKYSVGNKSQGFNNHNSNGLTWVFSPSKSLSKSSHYMPSELVLPS